MLTVSTSTATLIIQDNITPLTKKKREYAVSKRNEEGDSLKHDGKDDTYDVAMDLATV